MKKLLALLVCTVMLVTGVFVLAACDNDDGGDGKTFNITMWVGEGTKELTATQIDKFNKTNQWGVTFNATIEIQSESTAVGTIDGKPMSDWPDVYCFAQDQLARAVKGTMLHPLNSGAVDIIKANNSDETVAAATIGNSIRAFPLTADNGYFMYYDKRVVSEDHKGNLGQILNDVAAYHDADGTGRFFAMNLSESGGAWYAASFFYATGCKSEWQIDEDGNFVDYVDDINSDNDNAYVALQGMQQILKKSAIHLNSDKASTFNAATPSAVVISGVWDYTTALDALGEENLGMAPLPSFTVDKKDYQLVSYLGHKFMGITPQKDTQKAYYLQQLVAYLTGTECQQQRFEAVSWGPTDKTLQNLTSDALKALKDNKTTLQGQYPSDWWSDIITMTGSATTSGTNKDDLKSILDTYSRSIPNYKVAK